MSLESRQRYFRLWFAGCAVAILVTTVGTGISYYRDRPLLTGPTVPIVGTVVDESKGFLNVRNMLVVSYEANGQRYRRTIPVKGEGIGRKLPIAPYFYQSGSSVELLIRSDHPGQVRTKTRWTPAVYNWFPALCVAVGVLILMLILRALVARTAQR